MNQKIIHHQENLQQFIHTAVSWDFKTIQNSIKGEMSFGILTPNVIIARDLFDEFKNQLRLEFDKPENGRGFEISIKDMFIDMIKQYRTWYNKKEDEIEQIFVNNNFYSGMLNIMEFTEREIFLLYPKQKTVPEISKIEMANPYPKIFKNYQAFKIFERLNDNYSENVDNYAANYSFIYYAMKKDKFIHCRGVDFIEFISEVYEITIDRINSRQSGENKRDGLYNLIKENSK